jgi:uncharacterized protein (TIGR03435 family)
MMRIFPRVAVFAGLTAAVALGQEQHSFDIASVKVVGLASHPVFGNRGGPGTNDPSRIHLCCVGMFSLLMRAYGVEFDQIIGPHWIMDNMGPNLYQIDATMPAETTRAQFQLMMQSLLQERFHVKVHSEKRNFPGYELVVAEGGPKLKESKSNSSVDAADTSQIPVRSADGALALPPGPQMFTSLGRGMIIVQGQEKPISDLVNGLGRLISQSLGEDPNDFASRKPRVLDKTGLTGKYDFTLRFSCDGCQFAMANGASVAPTEASGSSSGLPNIFTALQKELGLRLVKVKDIPLDVIIVDQVDKAPTAN